MAEDLSSLSIDTLRQKLKAAQAIQRTVAGIFAVIVIAWIVLGYWRTNTPVFVSTIAMGVAALTGTSAAPRALKAELQRRLAAAQRRMSPTTAASEAAVVRHPHSTLRRSPRIRSIPSPATPC